MGENEYLSLGLYKVPHCIISVSLPTHPIIIIITIIMEMYE